MSSGDSLLAFYPDQNQPPGTIPATPDLRNLHPVLDFDATIDEEAVFSAVMPEHYGGGGVTVEIHYSMSSATTNNTVWQGAFERIGIGSQDVDSDGFAAFNSSGQDAVPGTSGFVGIATITFTNGADMDSVVAGELFRFKVRRDADDTSATDNAVGDAEMHAAALLET